MIQVFLNLSRKNKKLLMVSFDFFAIIGCIFLASSLRAGYLYYPTADNLLLLLMVASPLLALPIFTRFGLYSEVIRYVGTKVFWRINQAVTLYALIWGLFAFMVHVGGVSRSVIIINWILALMAIGGARFFARWLLSESGANFFARWFTSVLNTTHESIQKKSILIYGAGAAGRELCAALNQSQDFEPVAFIDNSVELYHQFINGLQVFNEDDIAALTVRYNIQEVLLAMPSITRSRRSEIIKNLQPYPVIVRSLPSLEELADGKVTVNDLLEINLRDLLGREPVKPNIKLLKTNITKKVVLVTGSGGSIGSELCRQIVFLKPKKLVLYDISESSLYQIEQELLNIGVANVEILPVIGSVTDKDRMEYICNYYVVKTIYHAAAYKHVPLVEFNPSQGILNNSIGTMVAAKAAIAANVETFVLISTDKAVRPTSIMGASKRVAELVLQALDQDHHNTCFTMVRFGNVLDSSGSVIPLFKKQIQAGGPITVTHADVVRYFMTIPEAVELVIQAGAMSKGGEVFVLDMGEPIRIHDLAVKMIQLSGLVVLDENNPKGDIEIQYTGLRPGEKLYEELLVDGDFTPTENKLIMRTEEEMIDWDQLEPMITIIEEDATSIDANADKEKIYKSLKQIVPQFNPQSNGFDTN